MTVEARPRVETGQIANWTSDLRRLLADVEALIAPLSEAQVNWRPGPGRWSVGECIDHLTVTGRGLVTHGTPAVAAARARGITGSEPFAIGRFARWWTAQVGPEPTRKVRTPTAFTPLSNLRKDDFHARFRGMQNDLIRLIESASGLDLGRIRVRSAASPLLRMSLAGWLDATVAHEQRHLEQARRVRTAGR